MTPWCDSILADTAGLIRFWNATAERLFGHAREEAVGQSLNLLVPERFRPKQPAPSGMNP